MQYSFLHVCQEKLVEIQTEPVKEEKKNKMEVDQ